MIVYAWYDVCRRYKLYKISEFRKAAMLTIWYFIPEDEDKAFMSFRYKAVCYRTKKVQNFHAPSEFVKQFKMTTRYGWHFPA